MIIGIGMDLVEIARIRKAVDSAAGERFIMRVLTEGEQQAARGKAGRLAEFVAGRFAAKEAVVKALGCGIGSKAGFQDIEICPDELGKPVCRLSESAVRRLGLHPDVRIHVTITHTSELAGAYAVVEQAGCAE
ncbi:holo-ACP synthase [Paenibacillus turpanensis]|uniref:holo-ACP synthase n=1 Tax=Paenibacillus turpanensis TaxID=2689078 RepID=UPI00140D302A|nr:holo-ACP synthase [Paenibacillus turpanensis]